MRPIWFLLAFVRGDFDVAKVFEKYCSAGLGCWKVRVVGAVNPGEVWRNDELEECYGNSCRDDGCEPQAAYENDTGGADDADGKWSVVLEPLVTGEAPVVETQPKKQPDQERDADTDDDANAPSIECDMLRFHETRATPNDPKLSDGGAWRGSCVVERRRDIRTTKKGGSE